MQTDIDRERSIILERIRSRDDNPGAVAFDLFAEHVHPNHSYGLRFIGTEASLAGITHETLAQYHRTFVRPGRLVVSVAGGMRTADILELLESALEDTDVPAAGRAHVRRCQARQEARGASYLSTASSPTCSSAPPA